MARAITTDPREYRRGMILGLTFAEIMLLLAFLLLLAAAALVERHAREAERLRPLAEAVAGIGLDPGDPAGAARHIEAAARALAEVTTLQEQLAELQSRSEALRRERQTVSQLVARLAAAEAERRQLEESLAEARQSAAEAAREQSRAIARAAELAADLALLKAQQPSHAEAANRDATVDRLARRIVELEGRLAAAEAERADLQSRLAEQNRTIEREIARRMIAGGVYPPCWEENGRPVFVFDVALREGGRIVVVDLTAPEFRTGEPWTSIGAFRRGVAIDVHDFVRATRPLTDWSRRQDPECRIWIRVRRELPVSLPTSEYLRVIGPLGSAANDHLPFYRVGG